MLHIASHKPNFSLSVSLSNFLSQEINHPSSCSLNFNSEQIIMKKSSFFAASVAAASATAISVSSSPSGSNFNCNSNIQGGSSNKDQQRSASMDKFAPRFDGLRFIETLVTGHR